jgi:hypothetical protein
MLDPSLEQQLVDAGEMPASAAKGHLTRNLTPVCGVSRGKEGRMRTVLIGGFLLAALAFAAPASAGCWATVQLRSPPAGTSAGDVWSARITVLQHGRNPLPDASDARPKLTIVSRASGERRTFTAKAQDPAIGLYQTRVVFPAAGAWRYEVFDGFTSWDGEPAPCARTHSFPAVQIARPSAGAGDAFGGSAGGPSGFRLWPLVVGLGAGTLLVAAVGLVYFLRRRGLRVPVHGAARAPDSPSP